MRTIYLTCAERLIRFFVKENGIKASEIRFYESQLSWADSRTPLIRSSTGHEHLVVLIIKGKIIKDYRVQVGISKNVALGRHIGDFL